jgi:hypothetical protein
MGELPQQDPDYYNNSRRIVEQGQQARRDREGIEQANDAARAARMEQAAREIIKKLAIGGLDEESQRIMASGWALNHGWNGDDSRIIANKVVYRLANPDQYGPLELYFTTVAGRTQIAIACNLMQQRSREDLALRIAQVTGNKQQAYQIVGAICDGD